MKPIPMMLGGLAMLAGVGISGEASSATVTRDMFSHGTANCQSALPVFDGNIRKRPMAVGNEGTGTAFVTCDTESRDSNGTGFIVVSVNFHNRAGSAGITVNCALVDGYVMASEFFPKASNAMPIGNSGVVEWTTADNGGENFSHPATSCALPPGVDISSVRFAFSEEIGA